MRTGSRAPYALTGASESADGYLYIAPIGLQAWQALCGLIGHPDWAAPGAPYLDADTRLRDRDLIEDAIAEWTLSLSNAQVIEACERAKIPCGAIQSVRDVVADPLLTERGMLQQVELGAGGAAVPMPSTEIKITGPEVKPDCAAAGAPDLPVVPALGAGTRTVCCGLASVPRSWTNGWRNGSSLNRRHRDLPTCGHCSTLFAQRIIRSHSQCRELARLCSGRTVAPR